MWLKKLFTGLAGICGYIAAAHAILPPILPVVSPNPPAAKSTLAVTTVTAAPITDANISVWANEIIVQIYTFDTTNATDRLKGIAKYFTVEGWPVFLKALSESKILETVKQNNYQVTAVALSPPRITAKGIVRGQYSWTVVMPTLVSYHNKTSQYKQYLEITLTMVYTGQKSGIRGLSMSQFVAKKQAKSSLCQCG